MRYEEVLEYLYSQLPMFQRIGAAAYKADLKNIQTLCEKLGNPEKSMKFVHIAGTNGKGSVSNMLAAVFQTNGYKTGLYTSPHLLDFRERIRINGQMISKHYVIQFVKKYKPLFEEVKPSFFEWTTALAFRYFYDQKTDIVILETGMGGRLDSTNVVLPELSIITNIGEDHKQFLGDTLKKIAQEKAGIIKPNVPVLISEYQREVANVFKEVSRVKSSPVIYASKIVQINTISQNDKFLELSYSILNTNIKKYLDKYKEIIYKDKKNNLDISKNKTFNNLIKNLDYSKNKNHSVKSRLCGRYQTKNIQCVLAACELLQLMGWKLKRRFIHYGLQNTSKITGFRGRWEILQHSPYIIADIAHNKQGMQNTLSTLKYYRFDTLHIIFGVVKDKEIEQILPLMPKNAVYYITQPSVPRAMPVRELEQVFDKYKLKYRTFDSVSKALKAAIASSDKKDLILITGSAFIVSDALSIYDKLN